MAKLEHTLDIDDLLDDVLDSFDVPEASSSRTLPPVGSPQESKQGAASEGGTPGGPGARPRLVFDPFKRREPTPRSPAAARAAASVSSGSAGAAQRPTPGDFATGAGESDFLDSAEADALWSSGAAPPGAPDVTEDAQEAMEKLLEELDLAAEQRGRAPAAAPDLGPRAPAPDFGPMLAALAEQAARRPAPAAGPAAAPELARHVQRQYDALMAAFSTPDIGQEAPAAACSAPVPGSDEQRWLAEMLATLGGPALGEDESAELQAMLVGLTGQAPEQAAPAAPQPAPAPTSAPKLDYSAMLAGLSESTPGSARVTGGTAEVVEEDPGLVEGMEAFSPVIQQLLQLAGQAPEGGGDGASMDGFLATMMQQFLSKDILYPSLKAITLKYPTWLEENQRALEPEDRARYVLQLKYLRELCTLFEEQPDNQGAVYDKLQQVQSCGATPEGLLEGDDQESAETGLPSCPVQ